MKNKKHIKQYLKSLCFWVKYFNNEKNQFKL